MSALAVLRAAPMQAPAVQAAPAVDALLIDAVASLDDAQLLEHLRQRPRVHIEPVFDELACDAQQVQGILRGHFEFNGEAHLLPDPVPWLSNPSVDVEWHILLHKFYDAVGLAQAWRRTGDTRCAQRWAQLLGSWLDAHVPVAFIAADVTGRRVQNWIYSLELLVFRDASPASPASTSAAVRSPVPAALVRRVLHSLHAQVEHLCAHLTPKRNHRTLELLAIYLAGVALPELRSATRWRAFAMQELVANVQADVLPDGVHCELSTDYHHLALRNWFQVRRLAADNGHPLPPALDDALVRSLEFSAHVHRPDGDIPSFSDGDSRSFLPVLAQAAEVYGRDDWRYVCTQGLKGTAPPQRVVHFADSGYHVVRSDWMPSPAFELAHHLVLDCGPLGEGNHGHFDALSFELHALGRPLVVDPGRGTYSEAGSTNWRVHFRGTAAHNTVCVDGLNQTRYEPRSVAAGQRHATGSTRHKVIGPPAQARWLDAASAPGFEMLHGQVSSAQYDALHTRRILFLGQQMWLVLDTLTAPSEHEYVANFQLGAHAQPEWHLRAQHLLSAGMVVAWPKDSAVQHRVQPGWVSPRYGQRLDAPRLQASGHASTLRMAHLLWPTLWPTPWPKQQPGSAATLAQHTVPRVRQSEVAAGVWQWDVQAAGQHHCWLECDERAMNNGVAVAGTRFHGRWLHLQLDARGQPVRANSHFGARLDGAWPVPLCLAERQP